MNFRHNADSGGKILCFENSEVGTVTKNTILSQECDYSIDIRMDIRSIVCEGRGYDVRT